MHTPGQSARRVLFLVVSTGYESYRRAICRILLRAEKYLDGVMELPVVVSDTSYRKPCLGFISSRHFHSAREMCTGALAIIIAAIFADASVDEHAG